MQVTDLDNVQIGPCTLRHLMYSKRQRLPRTSFADDRCNDRALQSLHTGCGIGRYLRVRRLKYPNQSALIYGSVCVKYYRCVPVHPQLPVETLVNRDLHAVRQSIPVAECAPEIELGQR